jgi:hypothetical protein
VYAEIASYSPILSVSDGGSGEVQASASVIVDEPNAPPVLSGIDDRRAARGAAIEGAYAIVGASQDDLASVAERSAYVFLT